MSKTNDQTHLVSLNKRARCALRDSLGVSRALCVAHCSDKSLYFYC